MFSSIKTGGRTPPKTIVIARFLDAPLDKVTREAIGEVDPGGAAVAACKRPEFSGAVGQVAHVFVEGLSERLLVVGLGDKKTAGLGTLRNAMASAARACGSSKASTIGFELEGPIKALKLDTTGAGTAAGEAFGLIGWNYDELRGTATTDPKRPKITLRSDSKPFQNGLARGLDLAEACNFARTLSQLPPNIGTTERIEAEAKKLARACKLKCTVVKGSQLEAQGLQGLINVGKASENEPRLIRLEYAPTGAKTSKPIVLIGKTMTYDSGGLSIKVGGSMKGMKRDGDGGYGVLGAMHAIANVIKPRKRVVALLSVAENSISDEAYRPDDVIEFANGVTVEVTNTDAEGRLVLADAMCWACKKENPAAIIDAATLTGGVVVALGGAFAGMWCDDDKLRSAVEEAGAATGERVWHLPHDSYYREMMRSPIADIVNSAPVREAHPIQGAAFLSYFIEDGIPWCHIDIAGTHATDKARGPFDPGPTGFGARLIAEAVDRYRG
ncbi:MAG: leucyl aminopeptidase family protein [Planctomycetota bacterium]